MYQLSTTFTKILNVHNLLITNDDTTKEVHIFISHVYFFLEQIQYLLKHKSKNNIGVMWNIYKHKSAPSI